MTFPILVTQANGTFTASVLGSPQVSADGPTKEQAVSAATARLRTQMAAGEVVFVDVQPPLPFRQVSTEDAAAWRELCDEIYRERHAQKAAEFPERPPSTPTC